MSRITNVPEPFENGIEGAAPQEWYGKSPVDGARGPFATAPVGSKYTYKPSTLYAQTFQKTKADGVTSDWAMAGGGHVITQTVTKAEFTDVTTTGTLALREAIPVGAIVLRSTVTDVTAFSGDTSATLQVGDGTDVDRYSTGTPSVFTTVAALDMGAVSGVAFHAAAKTPVLTITSTADFTNVAAAGKLTVHIYYLL